MINKEMIIKKVSKAEDKLLVAKVLDKAAKSQRTTDTVNTDFLDPYQRSVVEKALAACADLNYFFTGGYAGAERVILIFRPNFMSFDEEDTISLPLKMLDIKLLGRESLTHRDYLGSLMGLGIKREKIGDILVKQDSSSVIVLEELADYISSNLTKVGNIKVSTEIKDISELSEQEVNTKDINTTVASIRLDSIASSGFGMSRSKICEFIRAQKVNLNWEMTDNPAKQLKEGDTISIRGKGRVVLEEVGRTTKKGRISILLKRLV